MSTNQRELRTNTVAFIGGDWPTAASCLVIVLFGTLCYANSLQVPFLFDDTTSIATNPTIRSLANLKQAISPPGNGETVHGRPLLNLSFAVNYAWSGLNVPSWHIVNIAIHLSAGLCLFGVVRRTLLLSTTPESQQRRATGLAFASALLWTVHPLQTESVTYIVQRAESLAGMILLLTLYCSIRGAQGRHATLWQVAAVLASLAGMAAKEIMVAAPILVFLYDWAFRGEPLAGTFKRRWGFYLALSATWLVLAAHATYSSGRGSAAGFVRGVTSWEYLRTQFGFILLYLKLSVWPHPLVLDYGDRIASPSAEVLAAGAMIVLLIGCTLAALYHAPYRRLGFLGVWFFCILAPSSSFIPLVTQTGAEHRMYLPLAAVVVLIIFVADRFLKAALALQSSRFRGIASLTLLCCVAIACAALTVRRNVDYRTALSIWSDTTKKCPQNWRAQAYLATLYSDANELQRAMAAFDKSIRLFPNSSASFNDRGILHLRLRQPDEAISDFRQALKINPENANAQFNLGIALTAAGKLEPALAALSEAARIDPHSPHVHWRRGLTLMQMGRHSEAIEEFTTALEIHPQLDKPYNDRGLCYRLTNRLDEAIADFSTAIAINPREPLHFFQRGVALEMAGRTDESVRDFSAAIRLSPGLVAAYHARAVAYVDLERLDLARADLKELRRLGATPDAALLAKIAAQEADQDNRPAKLDSTDTSH